MRHIIWMVCGRLRFHQGDVGRFPVDFKDGLAKVASSCLLIMQAEDAAVSQFHERRIGAAGDVDHSREAPRLAKISRHDQAGSGAWTFAMAAQQHAVAGQQQAGSMAP